MISFLLDACAMARHYFPDIGTANVDQIFAYPNSIEVIPNLARVETASAMIATFNSGVIGKDVLDLALTTFLDDVQKHKIIEVEVSDQHISDGIHLLQRHKYIPRGQRGTGKAGIGGADAVYLAIALSLMREAKETGDRVILVTSDWALYQSALDEPELDVFHFWTCQCGECGNVRIPTKAQDNVCPVCGKRCQPCRFENCDSTFTVNFER